MASELAHVMPYESIQFGWCILFVSILQEYIEKKYYTKLFKTNAPWLL